MPDVSVVSLPVNTDNTGRRILGYVACLPNSLDKMLSAYYKSRFISNTVPILDAFNKEGYIRAFMSDLTGDYVTRDTQDAGFSALAYPNTQKYLVSEADESSVTVDISNITVTHSLGAGGFRPLIAFGRSDVYEATVAVLAGVFGSETQLKFSDGTTVKDFDFPIIPLPEFGINTSTQWSQGFGIGAAAGSTSGSVVITILPSRRITSIETIPNVHLESVSSIVGSISLSGRFYQEKETLLFDNEVPVMTPSAMQALPSFRQGVSQFTYENALGEETDIYYRVVVQPNARCQVVMQPDNTVSEPVVIDNVLRVPRGTLMVAEGGSPAWTVIPVLSQATDEYPLIESLGSYQLGFSENRNALREAYPATGDESIGYIGGSAWDGWLNHKALTITKAGCRDIYTYSQQILPGFAQEQLTRAVGAAEGYEEQPYYKYVDWEGYGLPAINSEVIVLAPNATNLERETDPEEVEPFVNQVFANEFLGQEIELYFFKLNYQSPPSEGEVLPYCQSSTNSLTLSRPDLEAAGMIVGRQSLIESLLGSVSNGDIVDGGGIMVEVVFLPENEDIAGWTIDWSSYVYEHVVGEEGIVVYGILDMDSSQQLDSFDADTVPTERKFYNAANLLIQIASVGSTGSFSNLVLEPVPVSNSCALLGGNYVEAPASEWTGEDHDEYICGIGEDLCCGCEPIIPPETPTFEDPFDPSIPLNPINPLVPVSPIVVLNPDVDLTAKKEAKPLDPWHSYLRNYKKGVKSSDGEIDPTQQLDWNKQ